MKIEFWKRKMTITISNKNNDIFLLFISQLKFSKKHRSGAVHTFIKNVNTIENVIYLFLLIWLIVV